MEPTSHNPPGERHLTATGFVTWQDKVLLHWHRKNRLWLPFGGHIESNEDPVQCVLREVEEETGLTVELYGFPDTLAFEEPRQLPPPVTILVESATDGMHWHEHVDMIYFCRAQISGPSPRFADATIRWLTAAELEQNVAVAPDSGEPAAEVPVDVRLLALEALRRATES